MMLKIKEKGEQFLKSNWYFLSLLVFIFIAWHVQAGPEISGMTFFNAVGLISLLVFWFIIVSIYDNMAYGIPIILGFSYLLNSKDLNLKTFTALVPLLIGAILFVAGTVIHLIRFRRKIKVGRLTIGLSLIAAANLIPLIYVEFSFALLVLSLVGIYHLLGYTLFNNYADVDIKYFFRFIYALSWLLVIQTLSRYTGYVIANGVSSIPKGIETSWGGFNNFGWGVINDVFIHLMLMLPIHVYYIIKRPNNFWYWIGFLIIGLTFVVSGSRGGVMGLFIQIPLYIYVFIRYGNYKVRRNLALFAVIILGVLIGSVKIIEYIIDGFLKSLENDPSTGRIDLYRRAIEVWKQHPLFGGGWMAETMKWGSDRRVIVYHSTFFHTLAIMGIFGVLAVIINWYESFVIMVKRIGLEKWLILIGFIGSQAYGMIDITQHAAFYMILLVTQLSVIEKSSVRTINTFDFEEFQLESI